ncbi:MAG: hypothetical protein D3913_03590 [Candidatus Electrothrix sp. LOE1_4_5]|nr:hypothetical protein [Candidatus Electrothrix gigas]
MRNASLELVMSEFGGSRKNAGGGKLSRSERLNPTLDSFRQVFPAASVTLYTDQDLAEKSDIRVVKVSSPFSLDDPRYGWRSHDYYQAVGMLDSSADVAIGMDSDMLIVSEGFRAIVELAHLFGLALPINPRLLLKIDGGIGLDTTYVPALDSTLGLGVTYNLTPMAFSTNHKMSRRLLQRYSELLIQNPGRGAVHLVNASYELGYHPCVLPPQWCVCSPRDLNSRHLWNEAVVLHVGHKDVVSRWKREACKANLKKIWNKVMRRC